jgi:phosphatidylserine/phosphatidylglycerophosphate/cardiolipin synthase-like enzyme
MLDLYAGMVDEAKHLACITLAFGINKVFKDRLRDNTPRNAIAFFLLEKKDEPDPHSSLPFIAIDARNNIYKAWGSYMKDPLYQWVKETSTFAMGLNTHVKYIHSKFLLMDPLGDDPIVVTGSANFSEASTNDNDENMLIIRGNQRVADIYYTEFNRLFNHYYFRSVTEATLGRNRTNDQEASLFLREKDDWLQKYQPGKLRYKRVQILRGMKGTSRA